MIVFSLNCRGLKDPLRLAMTLTACQRHGVKNFVLFLQETKISEFSINHRKLLTQHHLSYCMVPASDTAGGLVTIFPSSFHITYRFNNESMLLLRFQEYNITFSNCYVNPLDFHLEKLNHGFQQLSLLSSSSHILGGDFNCLSTRADTSNVNIRSNDFRLLRFRKLMNLMHLLDVTPCAPASAAHLFTHYDKRYNTFSRLDYFFTSSVDFSLETEVIPFSDHKLIKLCEAASFTPANSHRKLNDNILQYHHAVREVLVSSIASRSTDSECILSNYDVIKNLVRDKLRIFCIQNHRRNLFEENHLKELILDAEKYLQIFGVDSKTISRLSDLNKKLMELQHQNARKCLKQVKMFYVDANHGDPQVIKKHLSNMRKSVHISQIQDDNGEVLTTDEQIFEAFHMHYSDRFSIPQVNINNDSHVKQLQDDIIGTFCSVKRSDIENIRTLTRDRDMISEQEVINAITKLNSESAPGPDGLTSNFYKAHQEVLSPLLCRLFNQMVTDGWMPLSFSRAIIKLIPKKPNANRVEDFRPISLINTDQKILSHILSERVRIPVDKLIGPHQSAYLPGRHIHSSLLKVSFNLETMPSNNSLIAIDFSKAFDKLSRTFIFALLEKIGLHENTVKLIRIMYMHNIAYLDINGQLSQPVLMENGVRQGCPLSALIFILGIEPLLHAIQHSFNIRSDMPFKIISYADDLTCGIHTDNIQDLFDIIDTFSGVTNLSVNQSKTEILTLSSLRPPLQSCDVVKILGVHFSLGNSARPFSDFMNYAQRSGQYCNKYNTLIARARNIHTFVMQKLVHEIRHLYVLRPQLDKIDSIFIDAIWLGRKHNLSKFILQRPWSAMGIGLRNFRQTIVSSKIIDCFNFLYENNLPDNLKLLLQSRFFRNLKSLCRTFKCSISFPNSTTCTLSIDDRQLVISTPLPTKKIYHFLTDRSTSAAFCRISSMAEKLSVPAFSIFSFIRHLWKHPSYAAFEKNYLYLFFLNCYLEKTKKQDLGLVFSAHCCFCGVEDETFSHLITECQHIPSLNFFKTPSDCCLDFQNMNAIYPFKRLIALLISSWSEDPLRFSKYFLNCVSLRHPTILNHQAVT